MKKLFAKLLAFLFIANSSSAKEIGNMDFNELYKLAIEQNDARAQCDLGMMYFEGNGVEQDYIKAKQWFEKSAQQGDAYARFRLGVIYEDGTGVEQDYTKAKQWYEQAAQQGDASAQF